MRTLIHKHLKNKPTFGSTYKEQSYEGRIYGYWLRTENILRDVRGEGGTFYGIIDRDYVGDPEKNEDIIL